MKKFFAVFLAFLCLSCGFSFPVTEITTNTEPLEGEPFTINYPIDWKFKGMIDQTKSEHIKSIYRFRHPRNPNCYIIIEMFRPLTDTNFSEKDLNRILATKIRALKKSSEKAGYQNFSADTENLKFGGVMAQKMIVRDVKSGIERESILYAMKKNGTLYFLVYQWFNNWDTIAKSDFLKLINSFHLR